MKGLCRDCAGIVCVSMDLLFWECAKFSVQGLCFQDCVCIDGSVVLADNYSMQ